jgi:transposase
MRAGADRCWQLRSVMSMSSMSGASCVARRSTFPGANPGARATIPNLPPRLPTWSGCTWRHENAIVICVDEKPSIQALERAQGYLKLPNGRTLTGHSHDYKRNGTSTLFAAFEVATGKVTAAHKKRRRRVEFLDFMNDIVAAYPDTAIHVVLDNLNTHKPKNDQWLKRHPNVQFHFTPTRASWLNQVEIWFSILQGKSLHGASFTSVNQLREHIDAFIDAYNENAKPFVWTKSKVHQKRLKPRFADQ